MKNISPGTALLSLFVIWSAAKSIEVFFSRSSSFDYALLAHFEILWLGQLTASLTVIFSVLSIIGIIKKKVWVKKSLYAFLATSLSNSLITLFLSLQNPELASKLYLISRTERGLSTENVALASSPTMTVLLIVTLCIFYGALGFYIHKQSSFRN